MLEKPIEEEEEEEEEEKNQRIKSNIDFSMIVSTQ